MTTNWNIQQLERNVADGGVFTAHWMVSAVSDDELHSTGSYGSCSFTPDPADENFISFDDLTEADVLSWVWLQIDKDEIETNLSTQLELLANPITLHGLPW